MAALGTIRKRGALLIGIIGLGLFGFIAGDVFRSCETQTNEARMQVGEVLGEKISVQDFQTLVEEMTDVYKLQGMENPNEEQLNQLRDQAWGQFVNNVLLSKEVEKLGLEVTDEELQNVLKEGTNQMLLNTPFVNQQTRRFDISMLQQFLTSYKTGDYLPQYAEQFQLMYNYWKYFEKNLRLNILGMKYNTLLASCMLSNPISAKAAFDARNIDSKVVLASVAYSSLAGDSIAVTESELKTKYNENKEKYKIDSEVRDIKYVSYRITASAADRANLTAMVSDAATQLKEGTNFSEVLRKAKSVYAYNSLPMPKTIYANDIVATIDTLKVGQTSAPFETVADNSLNVVKLINKAQLPDSVQIRMIEVGGATLSDAKATADSIATAIKGGENFDTLAVKYNGSVAPEQWITMSTFATAQALNADTKKFLEEVFYTPVKTVKSNVLTASAFVLEVLDRRAVSEKYEVAVVKTPISFSNETYNTAYNNFSRFVSESKSIEELENNAAQYGYRVDEQEGIRNSAHNVVGIPGTGDAIKWMFDEAEVGAVSQLYECGDNDNLLVVALTNVTPKGYVPMENVNVKEDLRQEVLADKNFEVAKAKFDGVDNIEAAVSKGLKVDTLSNVTFATSAYVQSIGYTEPAISGVSAAIQEGGVSSVIKGNGGAYMLQVVSKTPRESQTYNEAEIENELLRTNMGYVINSFLNDLKSKGKVVDNRYLFF